MNMADQTTRTRRISVIDDNGNTIIEPSGITETFRRYYDNLYKSQREFDSQALKTLMDKLNIPTIAEEFAEQLETDLIQEEISLAINDMKVGKTPGPDGIPVDLYKVFQTGSLPKSITGTLITLLPKLGKPNNRCGNFRPISLLIADIKILSKI